MKKKSTRGGARPGSGRKPLPAGEKKVQVSVTLSPAGRKAWEELRDRGDDVNARVEAALLRWTKNNNKHD